VWAIRFNVSLTIPERFLTLAACSAWTNRSATRLLIAEPHRSLHTSVNRPAAMPISVAGPVEGTRANAYRGFAGLLTNGSPVLNLTILNAAIYYTLVVQDIVIVGSAEPWLISRGENVITSWALNY
jgi:hypothetical protein